MMLEDALKKHDWEKVRDALEALQKYTEANEPWAVNLLGAIETVLVSLPDLE